MGEAADVTGYEKGAAALLFINFALSLASGYFTLQAVTEIKQKQARGGGGAHPLLLPPGCIYMAHRNLPTPCLTCCSAAGDAVPRDGGAQ